MREGREIVYYVLHDGNGNYLRYHQPEGKGMRITTTREQTAAWFTTNSQEAYKVAWKVRMWVMALVAYE